MEAPARGGHLGVMNTKLLVFGATGGTGRAIVQAALAQGHDVTASARDPGKLDLAHPRLEIVRGDVLDATSVARTMPGHDAVICALGTPATTKTTVRSDGTRNILRAMKESGVRRLIAISSMGIGDSKPMLPFLYRYILVPLLLRQGFAEHELQERYIRDSGTEWTIVRPGALTNRPPTGTYRHGTAIDATGLRAKVSRADVANFVMKQLVASTYAGATPWISD
jgi:nucleoside-diphosphate-sugar epimerase